MNFFKFSLQLTKRDPSVLYLRLFEAMICSEFQVELEQETLRSMREFQIKRLAN